MLIIISINFLLPIFIKVDSTDFTKFKKEISDFRAERETTQDSINTKKKQVYGLLSAMEAEEIISPFNFDPNTLNEDGWLKMGFTPKQFSVINNYRKKGGKFKTNNDVKKMYGISESEYLIIEPYICIEKDEKSILKSKSKNYNNSKFENKKSEEKKPKTPKVYSTTELNSATAKILIEQLSIKPYLADRMIKYRKLLGGYYSKDQLLEVYGFPKSYYSKISDYIIIDSSKIQLIDINNVEFKTLLKHPYFDYETTKLVFNSKSKSKSFIDFNDFLKKTLINDSLSNKIRHYLYFGSPK